MADEPPKTPWYQDFSKVMLLLTTILGFITATQTQCNAAKQDRGNDKIDHVASTQQEQLHKAEVIKETVQAIEQRAAVVENKVEVIGEKLPKMK